MQFPSRRARVALLAGGATLALAAPAGAAVTPTYNTTTETLDVAFDGADSVVVTVDGGNVKVNGADPARDDASGNPTAAAAVERINVIEADANTAGNVIDLKGVTAAAFTSLANAADFSTPAVHVAAAGGDDTITGSEVADLAEGGAGNDRIVAARGNDVMNGQDGDDTTVWNPGEGSDRMTGGEGVDTTETNGAGGPETFTIAANGARVRVERTQPAAGFFFLDIATEKLVINGNGGDDVVSGGVGLADLVRTTLNGGDGNDSLTGTDGNDTLSGGTGNDRIAGARGNDTMSGDDGDDVNVWSNGEGSDRIEGNAGTDTVETNGAAGAEVYSIVANDGRVSLVRQNLGIFFLDIGSSETLDLNLLGGDDVMTVGTGVGALIKVDADGGDGNDVFNIRNDSAQTVKGGAGSDTAVADSTDVISEVENVDRGADKAKPVVKIASKAIRPRRGVVSIRLSCPAGETVCSGTARIVRAGKTVARTSIRLVGGQSKTYKLKLDRAVLRSLRKAKGRKLSVLVRVTATDTAGNTGIATRKLTLKR